jgi:hypothetical protein
MSVEGLRELCRSLCGTALCPYDFSDISGAASEGIPGGTAFLIEPPKKCQYYFSDLIRKLFTHGTHVQAASVPAALQSFEGVANAG